MPRYEPIESEQSRNIEIAKKIEELFKSQEEIHAEIKEISSRIEVMHSDVMQMLETLGESMDGGLE